jgi:Mg2+/citrate symporter
VAALRFGIPCFGASQHYPALTVFVMNMFAFLGFVTIAVFLAFVMLTRTPVIVALVLVPLATPLPEGFSGQVGAFTLDGNAALTTLVIVLLLRGLFPASVGLPELPAPLIFMVAFATALPINRRTAPAERDQIAPTRRAPSSWFR